MKLDEPTTSAPQATSAPRARRIEACNFRATGLLSNESTRQIRSLHETFARTLSHSLDLFLGSPIDVKLARIDQLGAREFGASTQPGTYIVPLALGPAGERVISRFENGLMFPLLDLLLGGPGDPQEQPHELTEIDEELFRSLTEIMCAQLERIWKLRNVAVSALPSLKPAMLGQLFATTEERLLVLDFEVQMSSAASSFQLALPIPFATAIVRGSQAEGAGREGLAHTPELSFRERLLHCSMPLALELPDVQVPLGELILLEPGSLLDLRASSQNPIQLRVEGYAAFDVMPVRRGLNKAGQITRIRTHQE